jgi:hypothetical protein
VPLAAERSGSAPTVPTAVLERATSGVAKSSTTRICSTRTASPVSAQTLSGLTSCKPRTGSGSGRWIRCPLPDAPPRLASEPMDVCRSSPWPRPLPGITTVQTPSSPWQALVRRPRRAAWPHQRDTGVPIALVRQDRETGHDPRSAPRARPAVRSDRGLGAGRAVGAAVAGLCDIPCSNPRVQGKRLHRCARRDPGEDLVGLDSTPGSPSPRATSV